MSPISYSLVVFCVKCDTAVVQSQTSYRDQDHLGKSQNSPLKIHRLKLTAERILSPTRSLSWTPTPAQMHKDLHLTQQNIRTGADLYDVEMTWLSYTVGNNWNTIFITFYQLTWKMKQPKFTISS